jgi:hypothetical protein
MLQNRTNRGEIVHKGQFHAGEHTPIIDQPLWDAVQVQNVRRSYFLPTRTRAREKPANPPVLRGWRFR